MRDFSVSVEQWAAEDLHLIDTGHGSIFHRAVFEIRSGSLQALNNDLMNSFVAALFGSSQRQTKSEKGTQYSQNSHRVSLRSEG